MVRVPSNDFSNKPKLMIGTLWKSSKLGVCVGQENVEKTRFYSAGFSMPSFRDLCAHETR